MTWQQPWYRTGAPWAILLYALLWILPWVL